MPSKFGGVPVDDQPQTGSRFGGVPVDDTPTATESHPIRDFLGNFGAAVNPIPGLVNLATHPVDTAKGLFQAQMDQFTKARADLANSKEMPAIGDRLMSAGGHALAGLIPGLGPAAAEAGEQIGNGDIAGGIGKGSGLIATMMLPKIVEGAGKALAVPAPVLAENALGIRRLDRAYSRTPGQAIINDTRGVRPETVAESARAKMGQLTPQLESKVAVAPGPADLGPARQVITDATDKAVKQNNPKAATQLSPMNAHLSQNAFTGKMIPQQVSPMDLLNLKRGFGDQFFHPSTDILKPVYKTANKAYGALDQELDRTAPEAKDLNQRISSLIPVATRAESTELEPGIGLRMLGRVARHTGALSSGIAGMYEGNHLFGPIGAAAGGIGGLLIPELISSPTAQMIAARTLNNAGDIIAHPATGQTARAIEIPRRKQPQEEK